MAFRGCFGSVLWERRKARSPHEPGDPRNAGQPGAAAYAAPPAASRKGTAKLWSDTLLHRGLSDNAFPCPLCGPACPNAGTTFFTVRPFQDAKQHLPTMRRVRSPDSLKRNRVFLVHFIGMDRLLQLRTFVGSRKSIHRTGAWNFVIRTHEPSYSTPERPLRRTSPTEARTFLDPEPQRLQRKCFSSCV